MSKKARSAITLCLTALASISVATSPAASADCATATGGAQVDCDGTRGDIRSAGPGSVMSQGNVSSSPGPGAVDAQGGGDDNPLNGTIDYDGTQDARTAGSPFYGPQYPAG